MLQRIQTLYLFGALIVNFLFLFVPIETSKETSVCLTSNISISVLALTLNGLLLFTIFSFKNRKRQMLICYLLLFGFLLEISLTILLVTTGSLYWNLIFPLASFELTVLALSRVKRDDQLVRSADRLR